MKKTKGRILCVDDHKDTREILTMLLALEGYEAIPASGVNDCLSRVISESFDLLMLDWVFEDGTGVDVCKLLRKSGVAVPIVFCSGVGNKSAIDKAMLAGAQGFLVKPIDFDDLLLLVSQFVDTDCREYLAAS
jgi:DNA-binding NtrC family response regulator